MRALESRKGETDSKRFREVCTLDKGKTEDDQEASVLISFYKPSGFDQVNDLYGSSEVTQRRCINKIQEREEAARILVQ